jgi:hypothetical protein
MEKWGWYMEGGPHGSASTDLMHKLAHGGAKILVADRNYYSHLSYVSAVINDTRSGASRRYEGQ